MCFAFYFNSTAPSEIYTLSLHDALPIFLAGQIGRLITISTTPVIAGDSFEMDAVGALRLEGVRSEERFSRNAETDLVCRLLLEKKKKANRSPGFPKHSRTTNRQTSLHTL